MFAIALTVKVETAVMYNAGVGSTVKVAQVFAAKNIMFCWPAVTAPH